MLVLSRKLGEQITIADTIVITVTAIRGNKVRIGVEAPRDLPIVRNELIPAAEPGRAADES